MRQHPSNVVLFFGGPSREHAISVKSAQSVFEVLNQQPFPVYLVYVTPDGQWHRINQFQDINTIGAHSQLMLKPQANGLRLVSRNLEELAVHVAFPLFHGQGGEDGSVQGLFEFCHVPYVGNNLLASALTMDKVFLKRLIQAKGLPTVDFKEITLIQWRASPGAVLQSLHQWPLPCFVKPVNLGSSLGTTKVKHREGLESALNCAFRLDTRVLVEPAIEQARDIEVALLGGNEPDVSWPGEVIPDGEFYDYYAKYESDKTRLALPAQLPLAVTKQAQSLARQVYVLCQCYGMLRVDFLLRTTDNTLFISEANPIPGFTSISLYPQLWSLESIDYAAVLNRLVQLALQRQRPSASLSYDTTSQSAQG